MFFLMQECGEIMNMTFLGKLLSKVNISKLSDVLINLELLAGAEAQISEYYALCANAMEKEKDFWRTLSYEESNHSESIEHMVDLINMQPDLYKPGISFNTVTIRLFVVEIQRLSEQMNAGQIAVDELYKIAFQIEDSVVELSYSTMVKTKDVIFNEIANRIDRESAAHKSALSSRMHDRQDSKPV
jgi:hypothetical protein